LDLEKPGDVDFDGEFDENNGNFEDDEDAESWNDWEVEIEALMNLK